MHMIVILAIGIIPTSLITMQAFRNRIVMLSSLSLLKRHTSKVFSNKHISALGVSYNKKKSHDSSKSSSSHFCAGIVGTVLGLELSSYSESLSQEKRKFKNTYELTRDNFLKCSDDEKVDHLEEMLRQKNLSTRLDWVKELKDDKILYEELIFHLAEVIDFTNIHEYKNKNLGSFLYDAFFILESNKQKDFIVYWLTKENLASDAWYLISDLYSRSDKETREQIVKSLNQDKNFNQTGPTYLHIVNHNRALEQMLKLPENLKVLVCNVLDYTSKEIKNDRIVFFHGQAWKWDLLATITKKLYEHKNKVKVDNDFYFLRFIESDTGLCEKHQKELAKNGLRQTKLCWEENRSNILFVTLALFANSWGSNPISYVEKNVDQSVIHRRNEKTILDIFTEYDFAQEIQILYQEEPLLFESLSQKNNLASQLGSFVTVSMPTEMAREIVYPTEGGGPRVSYQGMDDVVEIMNNFETMPFGNEYAIVLGPNMYDPLEAKKRDIKIKSWNSADQRIIIERDLLIDEIIMKCIEMKKFRRRGCRKEPVE